MKPVSCLTIALLVAACGSPVTNEGKDVASEAVPSSSPAQVAPSAVIPDQFHGRYDRDEAACARPSEYRLVVTAGELRFHESVAQVREVRSSGKAEIRVTADFEGEGESWRETRRLRLLDRNSLSVEDSEGGAATRVRCAGQVEGEAPASSWIHESNAKGHSLVLRAGGERRLTLLCPAGSGDLLVNVQSFRPVSSEDRMSLGSGGIVVALVADAAGDPNRGGVTGRGPIPSELPDIVGGGGEIGVNHGFQNEGPHEAPPPELASAFLAGCGK